MNDWSRLQGLIPILGGIYALVLAQGVLPLRTKDPEKLALWRRKFGGMIRVVGPLVIFSGVLQLLGIMR
jgi:hypothetical protein